MTANIEALRARFERRMNQRGWSEANIRRDGLDYSSTQITEAWHAYQAGYAAAKAETAAPVVAALIEAQAGLEFAAAQLPQTTGFVPAHVAALKIVRAALSTTAAQPPALPPEWVAVPVGFVHGFTGLAYDYSRPAEPPYHCRGAERDAFKEAHRRFAQQLAELAEILAAAPKPPTNKGAPDA